MILAKKIVLAFGTTAVYSGKSMAADTCTSIDAVTCVPVSNAPTLDGSTDDWSSVEMYEMPLTGALTGALYPHGNFKMQCVYDTDRIYFLFQVPGPYGFNATVDEQCAAMSTMVRETLVNRSFEKIV